MACQRNSKVSNVAGRADGWREMTGTFELLLDTLRSNDDC